MTRTSELEQRIEALESQARLAADREALRALKQRYARACDPTADADAIAALFALEGSGAGPFGRHDGQTRITWPRVQGNLIETW